MYYYKAFNPIPLLFSYQPAAARVVGTVQTQLPGSKEIQEISCKLDLILSKLDSLEGRVKNLEQKNVDDRRNQRLPIFSREEILNLSERSSTTTVEETIKFF
jgi:hypothetical protein